MTELMDLFTERAADYRATVNRCGETDLPSVLAGLLGGSSTIAVPSVLSGLLARLGDVVVPAENLTAHELNQPGLSVLTGCALAIAETGTIVLDGGVDQGRRLLTLIPDHHVCIVYSGQIVADVPDLFARLPDPTRPLTLISGPSATSDIELNRVEGVHGPRRLDIVCVTRSTMD